MFKEALRMRQALYRWDHPDIANTYWLWAESRGQEGSLREAKMLWESALRVLFSSLGIKHPTFQRCLLWGQGLLTV